MRGATVTKLPPNNAKRRIETIMLTPERAAELLEHNTLNRPLSQLHVERLARQIVAGKWKFNGDTIKIAATGDVLDGQHRLWAVIEAKKTVETLLVHGVDRDAFTTIDTLRKPRSGADVIALNGQMRYRNVIASALMWMLRWQRDMLESYQAAHNKIENSDIEEAFAAHGAGITRAAERTRNSRELVNQSLLCFLYYILANRDADLAERMMDTLEDPAGVATTDPFFKLRSYFTTNHHRRKEPLVVIALAIKAINAAHRNEKIGALTWKNQGSKVEEFPLLMVDNGKR